MEHTVRSFERGFDSRVSEFFNKEFRLRAQHLYAADEAEQRRETAVIVCENGRDIGVISRCVAKPHKEFTLIKKFLCLFRCGRYASDTENGINLVVIDI